MEQKEFSPFYSREYHSKKSVAEERQLFRWFQLLEQRCGLYHVVNKHDCLRADRQEKEYARLNHQQPRPIVVQPFGSVSNFYGCLVCGKYHICRLRRETCLIVVDAIDQRKACGYSGQLLHVQDNLEIADFDEDVRTSKEAVYYELPSYMKPLKTQSTRKRSLTKSSQRSQVIDLFNREKDAKPRRPTKRARHSREEYLGELNGLYDLSVESFSEEEEEEASEELLVKSLEVLEEPEETVTPISSIVYTEENENEEQEEAEWLVHESEAGECESATVMQENVNGEGSHAKNYHNNIRYMNDYYRFLEDAIPAQKHQLGVYERFMDLYRRDMKQEEVIQEKTEEEAFVFIDDKKLEPRVSTKIEDEVGKIIRRLIKIDTVKRPQCTLKPWFIENTLTHYFVTLVKNITELVYQSPVLMRVLMKRSSKNRTRAAKFRVSEVRDKAPSPEARLCPAKIARTLLLVLFTQPFAVNLDGYRVAIWDTDHWLASVVNITRYYEGKEFERFERELTETSVLVMECLTHYTKCALWLRDRVFKDVT